MGMFQNTVSNPGSLIKAARCTCELAGLVPRLCQS